MSKILVLGSEGQIGVPFCQYLEKKGYEVFRWDKVRSPQEDLAYAGNNKYLIDRMYLCDKVIFLAFEVGGSKFLEKADKEYSYIQENVRLMANTFNALEVTKKPFIFASSQMANMHHTNYGFLKDLGERYTKALGGWICRFWNVYGWEDPESNKCHVITDFINMAKNDKHIIMRTTGLEERQFLHVDDCSEAILGWVEDKWSTKEYYYDITSFSWVSVLDLAKLIANKFSGTIVTTGAKVDTLQIGIKNTPDRHILAYWAPKLTLSEGIDKLL